MAEDLQQSSEALVEALNKATRALEENAAVNGRLRKTIEDQESALGDSGKAVRRWSMDLEGSTSEVAKKGLGNLKDAAFSAGRAMLDGKKGAAALNESLGDLGKAAQAAGAALFLLGGPLGKLAGVVLGAIGAVTKYAQAANDMADKLYKGYADMGKAGGAAADGMTGLFEDTKKLGLSMNELGDFVNIVTTNSKDLALFSGSVSQGRKQLADMGKQLEGNREEFLRMGLSMTDVADGMAGYMRQQRNLTGVNKQTTDQLAEGARRYLLEQDALTKLTGQSRKEMEDANERAMQNEQFAAKIRQLEMSGQVEAAERLKQLNKIYALAGPATQEAFQATVTGNLTNARAQQAMMASNGEMMRTTQRVISGQMDSASAAQTTMKAMGEFNDAVGTTTAQMGANDFSLPFYEMERARVAASKDITAQMSQIEADQAKQRAGTDPLVKQQGELRKTQIDANEAMERFIKAGIGPAQDAMILLAKATTAGTESLNKLFGITPDKEANKERSQELGKELEKNAVQLNELNKSLGEAKKSGDQEKIKQLEEKIKKAEDMRFSMERGKSAAESGVMGRGTFDEFEQRAGGSLAAAGSLIEDFGKGTPAILHGREGVITEQQLKQFGDMAMKAGMGSTIAKPEAPTTAAAAAGPVSAGSVRQIMSTMMNQMDTMLDYQRNFGVDSEDAQASTVENLRRIDNITQQSRLELDKDRLNVDNFVDRRRQLYDGILANLDQQFQVTKATTSAQTPATGATPAGTTAPAAGAVPGGGAGATGEVTGMPSGGGAPPDIDARDYVKFTGGTGSEEHFGKLADNVESAFLMMARDYNALTGGKTLQVNSAFRSVQEQANVDSGTNPKAAPGMSLHNVGRALDIQSAQRTELEQLGLLAKYGFRPLAGDPPHISMAEGGIAHGPETGYPATLHGTEAVIPLGDGALTMSVPSVDTLVGVTEDMSGSISGLRDEIRSMMTGLQDAMSRNNTADLQGRMVDILENINRQQARTADASTRMAQAATN